MKNINKSLLQATFYIFCFKNSVEVIYEDASTYGGTKFVPMSVADILKIKKKKKKKKFHDGVYVCLHMCVTWRIGLSWPEDSGLSKIQILNEKFGLRQLAQKFSE